MNFNSVGSPALWAGFLGFVVLMLALDLGVFNRKDHVIRSREALAWSAFWIAIALGFGGLVWWKFGAVRGQEYLVGYVIEKALSVDNLFVFVALFGMLRIPREYQHRVLYWGILSALIMRAIMIFGGVALIQRFEFLLYVFGAFLIIAGVKLFLHRHDTAVEGTGAVRLAQRFLPTTHKFHGHAFLVREGGRLMGTPLLLALVSVEISDVIFAVDSIPAVFAVTRDPFIVFTSNIFAILGLRSLYFLLADVVDKFVYLRLALSAILVFVGLKMIGAGYVHVPPAISLTIILSMLAASIIASIVSDRRQRPVPTEPGVTPAAPPPAPAGRRAGGGHERV